jgi:hypothetical protein
MSDLGINDLMLDEIYIIDARIDRGFSIEDGQLTRVAIRFAYTKNNEITENQECYVFNFPQKDTREVSVIIKKPITYGTLCEALSSFGEGYEP